MRARRSASPLAVPTGFVLDRSRIPAPSAWCARLAANSGQFFAERRRAYPRLLHTAGSLERDKASLTGASRLRPGCDQPYQRARRYSATRLAHRRYRGGAPSAFRAGSQGSGGRPRRLDPSKSGLVPWWLTTGSRYGSISVSRPKSRAHAVGPQGPFGVKRGSGATAPRSRDPPHTRPSDP